MFISTQMEDLRKLKEEEVKNLEIKREEDLKMYAAQHQVNFRCIEYGIIGEGSQISTNQKRDNSAFSFLIGRNLRPFPENTVTLYTSFSTHIIAQPKLLFVPILF